MESVIKEKIIANTKNIQLKNVLSQHKDSDNPILVKYILKDDICNY